MFLNRLKQENKEKFLEICMFAALANDEFEDEEKEYIYAYCKEMELNVHIPDVSNQSLENVLGFLNHNTDRKEKNIIILETLGLLYCDGVYDDIERQFMNRLVKGLGITEAYYQKVEDLLKRYLTLCGEMGDVISM